MIFSREQISSIFDYDIKIKNVFLNGTIYLIINCILINFVHYIMHLYISINKNSH